MRSKVLDWEKTKLTLQNDKHYTVNEKQTAQNEKQLTQKQDKTRNEKQNQNEKQSFGLGKK